MSKISQILQGQLERIYGKNDKFASLGDERAIKIILSNHQDEQLFYEEQIANLHFENTALKEAEQLLRATFSRHSMKNLANFHSKQDNSNEEATIQLKQHHEKMEELNLQIQKLSQQNQSLLKENDTLFKEKAELQQKIHQMAKEIGANLKSIEQHSSQITSLREHEKKLAEEIGSLKKSKREMLENHEKESAKLKKEYLENLKQQFTSQQNRQNSEFQTKIIALKKELSLKQSQITKIIKSVSCILKLKQSKDINAWVQDVERQAKKYNDEIARHSKNDLIHSKHPTMELIDLQIKKVDARKFILSNYLNN